MNLQGGLGIGEQEVGKRSGTRRGRNLANQNWFKASTEGVPTVLRTKEEKTKKKKSLKSLGGGGKNAKRKANKHTQKT